MVALERRWVVVRWEGSVDVGGSWEGVRGEWEGVGGEREGWGGGGGCEGWEEWLVQRERGHMIAARWKFHRANRHASLRRLHQDEQFGKHTVDWDFLLRVSF